MMTLLLGVLGTLARGPIPVAKHGGWVAARRVLQSELRALGSSRFPPRTPTGLWALIQGRHPRPGDTFASLDPALTISDVDAMLDVPAANPRKVASWNLRWISSSTSHQANDKAAVIKAWLADSRPVALQETHWDEHDLLRWAHMLGTCTVHGTPGQTVDGRPCGGVAVVLPVGYSQSITHELVPGYAVAVDAVSNKIKHRFLSLYLRPGAQESILRQLEAAVPRLPPLTSGLTVMAGDINLQLHDPRAGEDRAISVFYRLLDSLNLHVVNVGMITKKSHTGDNALDVFAVPTSFAWQTSVIGRFIPHLSDHAALTLLTGHSRASTRRADPWLSAQAFHGLPAIAKHDLRRRFLMLEYAYGVPAVPLSNVPVIDSALHRGHLDEHSISHPVAAEIHYGTDDGWMRNSRDELDRAELVAAGRLLRAPEGDVHHLPPDPGLPFGEAGHDAASGALDNGRPGPADAGIPFLPDLADHGRAAVVATIHSWWKDWAKCKCRTSIPLALKHAHDTLPEGQLWHPSGAAAAWMKSLSWNRQPLTRQDIGTWITAARDEEARARRGRLRPWVRGPTAARARLANQYVVGRALLRKTKTLSSLKMDDGETTRDPKKIDDTLWQSRSSIWGSSPPVPPDAERVLQHYFRCDERDLSAADIPRPGWDDIAEGILQPQASAPGIDGIPYEAYHLGLRLTTCLIGQFFHLAGTDPERLDRALGPSSDLLVWIPKYDGADTPSGLRPLQLPTTLRRLFGAALARKVSPHVEPRLSQDQAAKLHGTCGQNIRAAFDHLASTPQDPTVPTQLYYDLLGPFATHLDQMVADVEADPANIHILREPAVLFVRSE